jgi:cytochrome P450
LSHDRIAIPGGADHFAHVPSGIRVARAIGDFGDLPLRSLLARADGRPVDLLAEVAAPWSFDLAMSVTQAPRDQIEKLREWAGRVFRGAADAREFGVSESAAQATSALAALLGGSQAPWRAQAFVALSETLPRLLAAVWLVLAEYPDVAQSWRERPPSRSGTLSELLRVSSPSRLVFRTAVGPVEMGGASISPGDTIHLALGAANHDPDVFPAPHRPQPDRVGPPHLAFGGGRHGCPGAGLVRRAVAHATERLLKATSTISSIGDVTWAGHAIRAPTEVQVNLTMAR